MKKAIHLRCCGGSATANSGKNGNKESEVLNSDRTIIHESLTKIIGHAVKDLNTFSNDKNKKFRVQS